MEVKACIFCKNCIYTEAIEYSEYTYQSEDFECNKGHFLYKDMNDMREGEIYKICLNCKDYDLKDSIKALDT